jgi:hypothetical protein
MKISELSSNSVKIEFQKSDWENDFAKKVIEEIKKLKGRYIVGLFTKYWVVDKSIFVSIDKVREELYKNKVYYEENTQLDFLTQFDEE